MVTVKADIVFNNYCILLYIAFTTVLIWQIYRLIIQFYIRIIFPVCSYVIWLISYLPHMMKADYPFAVQSGQNSTIIIKESILKVMSLSR